MRDFIEVVEGMIAATDQPGEPANPAPRDAHADEQPGGRAHMLAEMCQVMERLANFVVADSEPGDESYKLGVETGMQRAGEMLRHLLDRHGMDRC